MSTTPEIKLNRSATTAEAAAIAAAIQHFTADTTVPIAAEPEGMDPWLAAALEEGVSGAISFGLREPFGT